jgi:hypothetical protein
MGSYQFSGHVGNLDSTTYVIASHVFSSATNPTRNLNIVCSDIIRVMTGLTFRISSSVNETLNCELLVSAIIHRHRHQ